MRLELIHGHSDTTITPYSLRLWWHIVNSDQTMCFVWHVSPSLCVLCVWSLWQQPLNAPPEAQQRNSQKIQSWAAATVRVVPNYEARNPLYVSIWILDLTGWYLIQMQLKCWKIVSETHRVKLASLLSSKCKWCWTLCNCNLSLPPPVFRWCCSHCDQISIWHTKSTRRPGATCNREHWGLWSTP